MLRSIFILSFFLFSCSNFKNHHELKQKENNNIKHKNVIFKFDPLIDYPIEIDDPRIKSILYIINQKSNQEIIITYYNNRTKFLAKCYKKFFKHYNKNLKINIFNNKIKSKYLLITIT